MKNYKLNVNVNFEFSGGFQKFLVGRSTEMFGIEFQLSEVVYV